MSTVLKSSFGIILVVLSVQNSWSGWAVGVTASSTGAGDLVLKSTSNEERLLDDGVCYGACYSPLGNDGAPSEIAYVQGSDIYIIGVNGSNKRKIKTGDMSSSGTYANTLSWCNNGYIYFSRGWAIYRYNADGSTSEELLHTSKYSSCGDGIRQLQVARSGNRAASWGRPKAGSSCSGKNDGHVIIYTLGSPNSDRRYDNHCMGAISMDGTFFNACYASHEKSGIFSFDNPPSTCSSSGSCLDRLGVSPYNEITRESGTFDFHRFSQCDNDYICWTEGSRGYVGKVSDNSKTAHWSGFKPQDYYPGDFSSQSTGPSATIHEPDDGASFVPGTKVTIRATVVEGSAAVSNVEFFVNGSSIEQDNSEPYEAVWTAGSEDEYTINVSVSDANGNSSSDSVTIAVVSRYAYPDSVAHKIPGKIEAEHFDFGGQDIAYNDDTPGNIRGSFRSSEDVDAATGGSNIMVTATAGGEWLKYSVNITEETTYSILVSASNGSERGEFHLELDGRDISGPLTGSTGGYETRKLFTVDNVVLEKGEKTLTLVFDKTGHIVDYFEIALPKQLIDLTSPSANQVLAAGDKLVVAWTADTSIINDVHIEFSDDGGIAFRDLSSIKLNSSIDVGHDEWGNFSYTITDDMISSGALVQVREYGASRLALSNPFTITKKTSEVIMDLTAKWDKYSFTLNRVSNGLAVHTGNLGIHTIQIIDVQGKATAAIRLEANSNDIIPLAKGVYIVNSISNMQTFTRMISVY
ncbi:MAG: carbohydrate-binding protein [Chitinivibrionales bacterium]|nr:carbohydrate-binding protein [Chitinivibrionales bacterium]